MSVAAYYGNIFLESVHVASLIPLGSEPTFFAMLGFGGFNMAVPLALAVGGATLGQLFNWGLGRLLLNLKMKGKLQISPYWYEKAARIFNSYAFWLLLFCWAPLCNILVLAAGFMGARLKAVLPLVIAGEAAHYGLAVL